MIRTARQQRLANGGAARVVSAVRFEDRPAFRRDLDDEDGFFGDGYSEAESDGEIDAVPEDAAEDAAPASGIPFWPADEDDEIILPEPDVDMFVFRKVFASDLGVLFGQFTLIEMGPTFGMHRGVTEGISNASNGRGATCKLYVGRCGGWQVFVEGLSVANRDALKSELIQGFNFSRNAAGFIKAGEKPYIVAENNVRVSLLVWERVMVSVNRLRPRAHLEVTLCVYGTKMPMSVATPLWNSFSYHRRGTVDADFAFECHCPSGFPIFRSRHVRKSGKNSGTTRIWDRLGRAKIGSETEDFGTVRYCIPDSPHSITFYCKAIQALKVECNFDPARMPRVGKTARDRINNIKV